MKILSILLSLSFLSLGILSAASPDDIATLKAKLRKAELALADEKVKSSKADAEAARLMVENQNLAGQLSQIEKKLKAEHGQNVKKLEAEKDRYEKLIDSVVTELKPLFGNNFNGFDEIPGLFKELLAERKRLRRVNGELKLQAEELSKQVEKLKEDK